MEPLGDFEILADGEERERERPEPRAIVPASFEWLAPSELNNRSFLLGRHAARGFVSGTVAPGGVGKTALVLAECLGLATGVDIFKTGAVRQANVWYLGLEDSFDEYRRRVAASVLLHNLDPARIEAAFFLNVGHGNNFVMTERTSSGTEICRPMVDAIVRSAKERNISLIVVDPFVASHRAAESDNMTIAILIRAWTQIASRTGAAIELVHHTRKQTGDEPGAGDARGASALVNALRSVRMLVPMTDAEAARLDLDSDPARYFRVVPVKVNLSQRTGDEEWREFVSVPLGNGGDEVGAVRLWKPPPFASDEQLEQIREELSRGLYRADVRAETWAGKPIAKVLGLDVRNVRDRRRVNRAILQWVEEGVLRVRNGTDEKRNVRQYVQG